MKHFKMTFQRSILLSLFIVSSFVLAASIGHSQDSLILDKSQAQYTQPNDGNSKVYITKTGSKYHNDGCRYLSRSKIQITLKDASVVYSPCKVCAPPILSGVKKPSTPQKEVTVYVTRTGAKYHRGNCRYLKRSKIPMSLENASKRYGACSVCRPPKR